jgi:hypothetical protein
MGYRSQDRRDLAARKYQKEWLRAQPLWLRVWTQIKGLLVIAVFLTLLYLVVRR